MQKALICVTLLVAGTMAFAPLSTTLTTIRSQQRLAPPSVFHSSDRLLPILQRQRKSVAAVQTQGLFGLGAPEIVIILVAAAFVLGPQKIADLGRDAGKIAGELKEVPKEFQKGLEEGETNARAAKAKSMEEPPKEIAESGAKNE